LTIWTQRWQSSTDLLWFDVIENFDVANVDLALGEYRDGFGLSIAGDGDAQATTIQMNGMPGFAKNVRGRSLSGHGQMQPDDLDGFLSRP